MSLREAICQPDLVERDRARKKCKNAGVGTAKYQADSYLFSALINYSGVCLLFLVFPEELLPSVLTIARFQAVGKFKQL